MAGEVRLTMYFGQAQTGWSETWWYPPGRNTLFYINMQSMVKARVDMLAGNHSLLAVRVTDEGANRFTRLFLAGGETAIDAGVPTINLPGRGREDGVGSNLEGPPDQVRSAMHLEVINGGQRIGLRYLAGFPDDVSLTENPTLNRTFSKTWWQLFSVWRAKILEDGWAIKALNKDASFPLSPVLTYRIRSAAPSVLGVVIPSTAPWSNTIGQKVALQGVRMTRRGLDSPNGTWIIDGVEVDTPLAQRTIWLRGTQAFDPDTFLTLGKLRAVAYYYQRPSYIEPIRIGIHKRGKPFGSPVGRRPNR